MTGAMVMIAPGHPVQSMVATLLLLFYMLLLLKFAPYASNTEDWTSFFCSLTLLLTTFTGFAMHALTDPNNPNDPTSLFFGTILIIINITCLAVNLGIAVLFDMKLYEKITKGKSCQKQNLKTELDNTKVIPTKMVNEETEKVRTWSSK